MLRVEGIFKSFDCFNALDGADLHVDAGKIVAVIGPNGAGKSTLFNLVTGYLAPTAGTVSFKDRTITGLATNRIAELGVSRAFQIDRPFRDLSVAENVRIGALFGKAGAREVARTTRDALDLARIAPLAAEPASALTVGQLRPLEGARAVATRADLLLADEPCAGLTPTGRAAMIAVLRGAVERGVTFFDTADDYGGPLSPDMAKGVGVSEAPVGEGWRRGGQRGGEAHLAQAAPAPAGAGRGRPERGRAAEVGRGRAGAQLQRDARRARGCGPGDPLADGGGQRGPVLPLGDAERDEQRDDEAGLLLRAVADPHLGLILLARRKRRDDERRDPGAEERVDADLGHGGYHLGDLGLVTVGGPG